MISNRPRWEITVTHTPTGIVATRTSDQFRHQHMARDAAIKYLKSLLYIDSFKEEDLKIEEIS